MSPVLGAEDLERKNAYWIEFGKREELESILEILKLPGCHEWQDDGEHYEDRCITCYNVALIKESK